MADPYLSEIRIFSFGFQPKGWLLCNGQTLAISQFNALFALIGTYYGGNGTTTFQLPNLQGCVPLHMGTNPGNHKLTCTIIGQQAGEANVTLTVKNQISPAHPHRQCEYSRQCRRSVRQRSTGRRKRRRLWNRPRRRNDEQRNCGTGRWQSTTLQPAAIPGSEFLYCDPGHFSIEKLERISIMSDQFLAEIRIFPFNFAPFGWQQCNGQILAISQFAALFSLLGTYYGGNGTSNFALPNFQGSVPVHQGTGPGLSPYELGEAGGSTTVTLLANQTPAHSHSFSGDPTAKKEITNVPNAAPAGAGSPAYSTTAPNTLMAATMLAPVGGNQAHNNMQPYLTLNFCIATTGIFPSRN